MNDLENHVTYVTASCTKCHGEIVRTCISHDRCSFNYHTAESCTEMVNQVSDAMARIARDRKWLNERGW